MRSKIVAGNWKMNKTLEEAQALTSEIMAMVADEVKSETKIVLCTPFPYLVTIKNQLGANARVEVGAQNCSEHDAGAFTGEVSAAMIKSIGVPYVIIGHSERRQFFNEQGKVLATKVDKALANGLTPIFCCGEPLEIREKGTQDQLVKQQIEEGLFHLTADQAQKVVIAYEPVWAIGTGRTATSQQAQDMHAMIRTYLTDRYGKDTAENISILYGGSVKPDNAREIFSSPDVDGGLVGGASLKSRDFVDIVKGA